MKTKRTLLAAFLTLGGATGCTQHEKRDPYVIDRAFVKPVTLAVAPVLNFSGEPSFDAVAAADLLASELTFVNGVTVLPVNRVMAVLAAQGRTQVESPAHALDVCEAVGADGILIAGVTEYDAYTPTVGLILQMYAPSHEAHQSFEPILAERMAQPFVISHMVDPMLPTSQVQLVENGALESVQRAVRKYASPRDGAETHLGWRQYLKVQSLFLRFCWNDALTRLMKQERSRRMLLATAADTEERS